MDNLIEKISKKSKSAFEIISTSSVEKRNSAILNISKYTLKKKYWRGK